jgi:hypothetical protein
MNDYSLTAEEATFLRPDFLPSILLLGNILAHQEKRFYNSDTSQSAKRIAPSVRDMLRR